MKIAATLDYYDLPEAIDYRTARMAVWSNGEREKNPDTYLIAMYQLAWGEFIRNEVRATLGVPVMWSIEPGTNRLHVAPTPVNDTWFVFEYHPAMKVL